jgi:hypothetical protein
MFRDGDLPFVAASELCYDQQEVLAKPCSPVPEVVFVAVWILEQVADENWLVSHFPDPEQVDSWVPVAASVGAFAVAGVADENY